MNHAFPDRHPKDSISARLLVLLLVVTPTVSAAPHTAIAAATTATHAPRAAAYVRTKVQISAMQYAPYALTVHVGDEIVWHNADPFPHTVTFKGSFDSGVIPAQGQWIYRASKAGVYAYVCSLHPDMHGLLIVKAKAPS